MSPDLDQRLAQLRELLLRHRADRHPEEHATLQFHLGATLLDTGRAAAAQAALRASAELFGRRSREVEQAKAHNLLGAALLQLDELDDAAATLRRAAEAFSRHQQPLESAAARFNLGLVQRRRGEPEMAVTCFSEALATFDEAGAVPQASAAARELGGAQLDLGDPAGAADSLERALELAKATGDRSHVGAAANLLGLAHLGADAPAEAAEAFRLAASAYPRPLDPAQHAMATANLALAHERLEDLPRARLAAWRARQVPQADPPVVEQAAGVLARLGPPGEDLVAVLDREATSSAWSEELGPTVRALLDADEAERCRLLGHWIDGQLASRREGAELGATLCELLLELPGRDMTMLVRSLLAALQERDPAAAGRFRSQMTRAMARFHLPQWQRLEAVFTQLATEIGDEGPWS